MVSAMGNIDGVVAIVVHQAAGGGDCTIWQPAFSWRCCLSSPAPPYTQTILMSGRNCARFCRSWAICWASSRVGLQDDSLGLRLAGSTLDRMGMPNATVLPVPVGPWQSYRGRPASAGWPSWISVISVKAHGLRSLQDLMRNAGKFRKLHVCTAFVCFTLIFYYNRLCNAPQDGDTQKGLPGAMSIQTNPLYTNARSGVEGILFF